METWDDKVLLIPSLASATNCLGWMDCVGAANQDSEPLPHSSYLFLRKEGPRLPPNVGQVLLLGLQQGEELLPRLGDLGWGALRVGGGGEEGGGPVVGEPGPCPP